MAAVDPLSASKPLPTPPLKASRRNAAPGQHCFAHRSLAALVDLLENDLEYLTDGQLYLTDGQENGITSSQLGGGTFHERYEPELLGFAESTPQYQGAMQSFLSQLQTHLREQDWLDEAFVYWFDEPDPKDYEFVSEWIWKAEAVGAELRRMLTEQIEPGLVGGPNIWCPLTPSYDEKQAAERRAEGESFWWYVCTGPKAPYCTLFIDHPATEMRVWLWQTWQRNIAGVLVWDTNYWTSSAAYPDPAHPQNPYDDPMGWVSGYSTPDGSKQPWGNGDGRFLYPPEAAATVARPLPCWTLP